MSATGPGDGGDRTTVVRLPDHWFVACASRELSRRPLPRTIQGVPLALFRDDRGEPAALLDRCPHRNVPLSLGRAAGPTIECAYHGWRFDGAGICRRVPGLVGASEAASRRVPSFPVRERDGWVWVYGASGAVPDREPFRFPFLEDRRYTIVRRSLRVRATLHAAIENALDVPHTAYLHGGLFRTGGGGRDLEVVVRRGPDRVEAVYLGEPRPSGLVGRLLAPRGGAVAHVDRFVLPCVAQVDYRLGASTHLSVTSAFTPVDAFVTDLHASLAFRLPIPGAIVRPLVEAVVMRIVRQDVAMLAAQTDTVRRFGGERFSHTAADVLGPSIAALLRQAERGERGEEGVRESRRILRL